MAATATSTSPAAPQAPTSPAAPQPPTSPAAPPDPDTANASVGGFDDLFVQPVDPDDGHGSLPTMPSGWRHAGLVELVARQPRERRETILAGAFALTAVLWAPLGVFAFMTRNALLFGAASLVVAVVAAAPRPATASGAVADLADRAGQALDRVGPAVAATRDRLAPLVARTRERLAPLAARLREQVALLAPRLRDGTDRVAAALRAGGHRVAVSVRSADRTISAAVRRGLDGLHSGGGGDHSTPSSAR